MAHLHFLPRCPVTADTVLDHGPGLTHHLPDRGPLWMAKAHRRHPGHPRPLGQVDGVCHAEPLNEVTPDPSSVGGVRPPPSLGALTPDVGPT